MGQLLMTTSGKRSLTKGRFLPSADLLLPFSVVPLRTALESVLFRRRSFRSFFLISVAVSSPSSSHLTGAELEDSRDMPDAVDRGGARMSWKWWTKGGETIGGSAHCRTDRGALDSTGGWTFFFRIGGGGRGASRHNRTNGSETERRSETKY